MVGQVTLPSFGRFLMRLVPEEAPGEDAQMLREAIRSIAVASDSCPVEPRRPDLMTIITPGESGAYQGPWNELLNHEDLERIASGLIHFSETDEAPAEEVGWFAYAIATIRLRPSPPNLFDGLEQQIGAERAIGIVMKRGTLAEMLSTLIALSLGEPYDPVFAGWAALLYHRLFPLVVKVEHHRDPVRRVPYAAARFRDADHLGSGKTGLRIDLLDPTNRMSLKPIVYVSTGDHPEAEQHRWPVQHPYSGGYLAELFERLGLVSGFLTPTNGCQFLRRVQRRHRRLRRRTTGRRLAGRRVPRRCKRRQLIQRPNPALQRRILELFGGRRVPWMGRDVSFSGPRDVRPDGEGGYIIRIPEPGDDEMRGPAVPLPPQTGSGGVQRDAPPSLLDRLTEARVTMHSRVHKDDGTAQAEEGTT